MTVTIVVASTKPGIASPNRPTPWLIVSRTLFGRDAATRPTSTPPTVPRMVASTASSKVTGSADAVSEPTDWPLVSE